VLTNVI
jgi:Na+/proline symporter